MPQMQKMWPRGDSHFTHKYYYVINFRALCRAAWPAGRQKHYHGPPAPLQNKGRMQENLAQARKQRTAIPFIGSELGTNNGANMSKLFHKKS